MLKKILLTGLLAAAVALAQRGGGGGSGGGMGGESMGGMGGGGFARVDRLDTISGMMKLTKDQKKMVKSTLDEGQKEAAPVRDQLAKTRKAIAEAVVAGGQDGLAAAVNSHAAAEAQMVTLELKAFAKIYPTLDKEQQQGARDFYSRILPGMFKGKSWNE
jgi:Spy/CpxP family protein refolding chaperone